MAPVRGDRGVCAGKRFGQLRGCSRLPRRLDRSRTSSAGYELIGRIGLTHERPPFGIDTCWSAASRSRSRGTGGRRHAVRVAAALRKGDRGPRRAARGAARRAAVGPLRHAACATRCGRWSPTTTCTSPIGTTPATCRWRDGTLRLRRVHRAPRSASSSSSAPGRTSSPCVSRASPRSSPPRSWRRPINPRRRAASR